MVEHEGRSCFPLEKAVCEHSEERSMLLQRAICHSPHMMDVGNLSHPVIQDVHVFLSSVTKTLRFLRKTFSGFFSI